MYNPLPATGIAATAYMFGMLSIAVALITLGYMILASKNLIPAKVARRMRSK